MAGALVLGGGAGLVALWLTMSALEGLGYAFPSHPGLIVPERWANGARNLLWVILFGFVGSLLAGIVVSGSPRFGFFHLLFVLGALLPLWELFTARVYANALVIMNGEDAALRKLCVESVGSVFGSAELERDTIYTSRKDENFLVDYQAGARVFVLLANFKIERSKRTALERALIAGLNGLKHTGFNERAFWTSVMLPLALAVINGWIAYVYLSAVLSGVDPTLSLRGTGG